MRQSRIYTYSASALCFLLLASCVDVEKNFAHDAGKGLTREDYMNVTKSDQGESLADGAIPPIPEMRIESPQISLKPKNNVVEPPIPDLAEIIAAPRPPKIGHTKLVSVSVTDDVPLKDVLVELSRLADVDMEIDSGIVGGITFRAKDRPFNEVIDRICDMAGLRYSMRSNVLRLERDVPYVQTYALDMLNIIRESSGNIGVSTGSGGGGGSSSGSSGGSSSTSGSSGSSGGGDSSGSSGSSSTNITAQSKSDFWQKFDQSVKQILAFKPRVIASGILADSDPASGFYSLNQQAGTLTFSGTERQHSVLRNFLKAIESNTSAQVLIEAKIVEVKLNNKYQAGIDWSDVSSSGISFSSDLSAVSATNAATSPATIGIVKDGFLGTSIDLSAAVDLLNEFGTTRALSSPRLNAMNNQQAVLSFTENLVYFNVTIETTDPVLDANGQVTTPGKVEVTSTQKVAPVGIVLTLQPTINVESGEITLSVRPTLSRVTKFVTDPGFALGKATAAGIATGALLDALTDLESSIPQLEVREMDSILKVKSGQVMVIGGLLEDKFITDDAGVPVAEDVPYVGSLFKNTSKTTIKQELVIFIRATIVPSSGSVHSGDKGLYNKFVEDPRPLDF